MTLNLNCFTCFILSAVDSRARTETYGPKYTYYKGSQRVLGTTRIPFLQWISDYIVGIHDSTWLEKIKFVFFFFLIQVKSSSQYFPRNGLCIAINTIIIVFITGNVDNYLGITNIVHWFWVMWTNRVAF